MSTLELTEFASVSRKNAKPPSPKPGKQPSYIRIEFQAPPDLLPRLDAVRKRRGLSRSAYIRQAVLRLIDEDERND